MSHSKSTQNNSNKERLRNRGSLVSVLKQNILVLVLVGLLLIGLVISKTFPLIYNVQNIMTNVSIIGMLAIGQTLVMLVKEIDLSQGSMMAFSPIVAIWLSQLFFSQSGRSIIQGSDYVVLGLVPIIVLTLAVGALIGLLSGVIIVKGRVPSLIVTLGMLYSLRGLAYIFSGGFPMYFTRLLGFNFLGTAKIVSIPLSFWIYLLIGIFSILLLQYTKIGARIYATGGNEKAATYSGVNTDFWKICAFIASGLLAAVGALIYSSRAESVEAAQANGYELQAVAIAIIGGTTLEGGKGRILGTLLAGLILGIVINIFDLIGLVVWYKTMILGAIVIAATFAYISKREVIIE